MDLTVHSFRLTGHFLQLSWLFHQRNQWRLGVCAALSYTWWRIEHWQCQPNVVLPSEETDLHRQPSWKLCATTYRCLLGKKVAQWETTVGDYQCTCVSWNEEPIERYFCHGGLHQGSIFAFKTHLKPPIKASIWRQQSSNDARRPEHPP